MFIFTLKITIQKTSFKFYKFEFCKKKLIVYQSSVTFTWEGMIKSMQGLTEEIVFFTTPRGFDQNLSI